SPATVHPHSRGERALGGCLFIIVAGSSPLAWGEAAGAAAGAAGGRFIPTRVGRGPPPTPPPARPSVHPHSRGERGGEGVRRDEALGSSPLAWGEGVVVGAVRRL